MKKNILLLTMLLSGSLAHSGVSNVTEATGGAFQALKAALVQITETRSGEEKGPDISEYAKGNRKFFAKVDTFGMDRWFTFENKEDADHIQSGVRNGGGWGVVWYYLDPTFTGKK